MQRKEEALITAREWQDDSNTVWTDGSRLENGAVGPALVFQKEGGWITKEIYLGNNKEALNAEAFAIMCTVRLLGERGESGKTPTSFRTYRQQLLASNMMVVDQVRL